MLHVRPFRGGDQAFLRETVTVEVNEVGTMRYGLALGVLLTLILGVGSSSSAATEKPANYDAFGIGLLQRLASTQANDNVFISPVSIGVALAMAADGAAGSTRSGMLRTLGLQAVTYPASTPH